MNEVNHFFTFMLQYDLLRQTPLLKKMALPSMHTYSHTLRISGTICQPNGKSQMFIIQIVWRRRGLNLLNENKRKKLCSKFTTLFES